jgi:hypothetical protein
MALNPRTVRTSVSIVPQSGLQFLRVALDLVGGDWDAPGYFRLRDQADVAAPGAQAQAQLEALTSEQRRASGPEATGIMSVQTLDALRVFSGDWVPLPYLKLRAPAPDSPAGFDRGPTNWARIRMDPIGEEDEAPSVWKGVLALDTAFTRPDQPTLGLQMLAGVQEFELCAVPEAISWFVAEGWVDGWLKEMLAERADAEAPTRRSRNPLLHRAMYFLFLRVLLQSRGLPRLRLVDTISDNLPTQEHPVDVDFVLDVGNCRTCGVLVESDPTKANAVDLNDSYPLELCDLTHPEKRWREPFESCVEFARASFGREMLSRSSGRQSAVNWPSPIRVGPEAIRLASAARGNEGMTGISTPKRYLWDTQPARQFWHFNSKGPNDPLESVRGNFMKFLHESGATLNEMPAGSPPAGRALFSKSSLFMLMMVELLLQAIRQINAPDNRAGRRLPDVPRRLRRLVLTIPTTMPMAEQQILRRHAQSAVWCVWRMMGWDRAEARAVKPPTVVVELDEASATQLVFLYTMVKEMFAGSAADLLSLSVPRPGEAPAQVRIASIDIGGGTTDLMVARYTLDRGVLIPEQLRREGPKLAGDDLLREVIQELALPPLRRALEAAGMARADAFLAKFFAGPTGGQDEEDRFLRRQFVLRVLEPAGYAILGADENVGVAERGEILRRRLGDILSDPETAARAIAHFEAMAAAAGATRPVVLDTEIAATTQGVARVVAIALGPMLVGLCRLVRETGCDWLLLSGRPSRLRAIRDIILAELPVWPNRILQMHELEVGDWYPFRNANGLIADPKTTAVVGATLAVYAERSLAFFNLRASQLKMRSTARYFGIVDRKARIRAEDVLAKQPDASDRRAGRELAFEVPSFSGPTYLGFRQQDTVDWPATPLFLLTWVNEEQREKARVPLRVFLRRPEIDLEDPDPEPKREALEIDEVRDRDEIVIQTAQTPDKDRFIVLQLRTMVEDTYWRDAAALTMGIA